MKSFDLYLRLEEDAVFSERAATVGGHRGLDYIPGSNILGAVAASLYARYPKDAFRLFHSGQVRFGNGRPVTATGQPTFPLPLCWHYEKGQSVVADNGFLNAEKIFRLGRRKALPEGRQAKQLRQGYVSCAGEKLQPKKALRLKTAIDPETGRAREAALFGYDAIAAGQCFVATIAIDDAVDDALVAQIREVLQGTLYLGRSRSAEYGKVHAEIQSTAILPSDNSASREISLWLLADLAAVDGWHQPHLYPQPEWLGLPPGKLVLAQSFVRSRRYSPWNAYRGRPELERQVLCQGSVLHFLLKNLLTAQQKGKIASGLGLYREAGLGQVWLNSPLLEKENPCFTEQKANPTTPSVVTQPHSDLITWLAQQQEQTTTQQDFSKEARKIAQNYRKMLHSARRLQGLAENTPVGPSRSQWGAVLAKTKSTETLAQLVEVAHSKMLGWKDEYWDVQEGKRVSFEKWLHQVAKNKTPRFMQLISREIMAIL